MNMKKIAAAVIGLAGMSAAWAGDAPKNMVYFGYVDLTIHSDAPDLTSNGPAFLTPPASLSVRTAQTALFGYVRHLDEKWAFEIAAGIPPAHDVYGTGGLAPYGKLAKVKQASPTLFLNYKFNSDMDRLRPYVGIGMNFTRFYDAESTAANNLAAGGPTQIRLKDSVGLAAQAGINYKLTDNWSINGNVVVANVETDLTATTGSIQRKTHIDFRPIAYAVSVGYSF